MAGHCSIAAGDRQAKAGLYRHDRRDKLGEVSRAGSSSMRGEWWRNREFGGPAACARNRFATVACTSAARCRLAIASARASSFVRWIVGMHIFPIRIIATRSASKREPRRGRAHPRPDGHDLL